MVPFTRLTALAAPLPEDNVDTDIILPARFLLLTEKKGLGVHAFHERRQDPDFVLNQPRYAGAQILVAGGRGGCRAVLRRGGGRPPPDGRSGRAGSRDR